MLQLLCQSLITRLSTILKNYLNTWRNILLYLFTYCFVQQHVYQSRVYFFEELLDIWHGLQQSAVDTIAIDRECVLDPWGGGENITGIEKNIWPKCFVKLEDQESDLH